MGDSVVGSKPDGAIRTHGYCIYLIGNQTVFGCIILPFIDSQFTDTLGSAKPHVSCKVFGYGINRIANQSIFPGVGNPVGFGELPIRRPYTWPVLISKWLS